jgi:hypothetical protein
MRCSTGVECPAPTRRILSVREVTMLDWIVIAVLYVAGIGFFHLIGGVESAGEALKQWGHAYAERKRAGSSPGS